jgi:large subunit ribosomal protein L2
MDKQKTIKKLKELLPKHSGRDVQGHIAVRHQGGRHKRFYRTIDWKRDKDGIPATVIGIEYDPNRTADIALLKYRDGDKRYILAPHGLRIGQSVLSGETAPIRVGNMLPLRVLPLGTVMHGLEIKPGRGAQMVRGAGNAATLLSKDGDAAQVKLPSGEIRIFHADSRATIGQLGNVDWKNQKIGKAGRARHFGRRPSVRGVAQHPGSHPHGGGEGRSGIGMPSPKSPWGKRTLGKKTRRPNKYSDAMILKRRK